MVIVLLKTTVLWLFLPEYSRQISLPYDDLRRNIGSMRNSSFYRHFRSTVLAVTSIVRVVVMVFAIAFGPLGLTLQQCHCSSRAIPCLGDSCCCTNGEAICGEQECCGEHLCDVGQKPGQDCSSYCTDCDCNCDCNCHTCQCDLGLAVNPERMPAIKEVHSQALDEVRWWVEIPMAKSTLGPPEDLKFYLTRDIQSLHCRWMI